MKKTRTLGDMGARERKAWGGVFGVHAKQHNTVPLSERDDLIIKEWTSKKGIEFVMYNNQGMNLQLEKRSVKYHEVDENGMIS